MWLLGRDHVGHAIRQWGEGEGEEKIGKDEVAAAEIAVLNECGDLV